MSTCRRRSRPPKPCARRRGGTIRPRRHGSRRNRRRRAPCRARPDAPPLPILRCGGAFLATASAAVKAGYSAASFFGGSVVGTGLKVLVGAAKPLLVPSVTLTFFSHGSSYLPVAR